MTNPPAPSPFKYSYTIALPFLMAAAAAGIQVLLAQLTEYHPSTTTGALIVALALPVGDAIRAQILMWQTKQQPLTPPAPLLVQGSTEALPAAHFDGPAIDPDLTRQLLEATVRAGIAASFAPAAPPQPEPPV